MDSDSPDKASLFRKEALANLLREEDIQEPLRVSPPWTWSLAWVMGAATTAALLGSIFGKVEVLSLGKGVIRPLAGVRLLQAQVGGTVGQIYAHTGDRLRRGQPIAHIEAAQVESSIIEADHQLALLRSEGRGFSAREELLTQEQIQSIKGKIATQQTLIASYASSVEFQRKNVSNIERLITEKLEARFRLDEAQDQLNNALRQQDLAKQQLVQLRQELSALESTRQRQTWQHSQEMHGVQSKRESLESTLRQTEVTAPVDGFLEALVAKRGDVVQPGQAVAKVIPEGSPLQVVAFLAEKDRSEMKPGALVNLDLVSYPSTEYGTLKGRILRIGSDLVSPYEVREVMGEEAKLDVPSYRVDIEIQPERPKRLKAVELQPGMQIQARFTLRRQRLITLVLDPLRQWLE